MDSVYGTSAYNYGSRLGGYANEPSRSDVFVSRDDLQAITGSSGPEGSDQGSGSRLDLEARRGSSPLRGAPSKTVASADPPSGPVLDMSGRALDSMRPLQRLLENGSFPGLSHLKPHDLAHVVTLNLSHNNLTVLDVNLLAEVSGHSLRHLDVSHNKLMRLGGTSGGGSGTGVAPLPPELSELESLNASHNEIKRIAGLDWLAQLRALDLRCEGAGAQSGTRAGRRGTQHAHMHRRKHHSHTRPLPPRPAITCCVWSTALSTCSTWSWSLGGWVRGGLGPTTANHGPASYCHQP